MNSSDTSEIEAAFFADGYQLAKEFVGAEISTKTLYIGIKQLYIVIDDFMKLFLETSSQGRVSSVCTRGCAWCCNQAVYAQSHEFDHLEIWLKMNMRTEDLLIIKEKSKSKLAHTSKLNNEERALYKSPCPLLLNNECIAYAARPMACRIYTSFDLDSCKHEYLNPADKENFPQLFDLPFVAGRKLNEGFSQWLKEQDKDIKEYSIEEGLNKTDG